MRDCTEGIVIWYSNNNLIKYNQLICCGIHKAENFSENNIIEENEIFCDNDNENGDQYPEIIPAYPILILYCIIGIMIIVLFWKRSSNGRLSMIRRNFS